MGACCFGFLGTQGVVGDDGSSGLPLGRKDPSPPNRRKLRSRLLDAAKQCQDEGLLAEALNLLQDIGDRRCSAVSFGGTGRNRPRSRSTILKGSDVLYALDGVKKLPCKLGLDIGGTLAKLAYMHVAGDDQSFSEWLEHGLQEKGLSFNCSLGANEYTVHCISGTTFSLEKALRNDPLQDEWGRQVSPFHIPEPQSSNDEFTRQSSIPHQVMATGGGAHAFAQSMRKLLNVDMVPFQEMQSLVCGLTFLHAAGPDEEVFTINADGVEDRISWPETLYPCLLVNMGSGVSILEINYPEDSDNSDDVGLVPQFVRVGGTACGGATFLGLARLLTSARTFPELLDLANRGVASRVNKLVGDIYGEAGCAHLGLPASLTAAHFGKLTSVDDPRSETNEADVAAALLIMVVQESAIIARAFAQLLEGRLGMPPPVFFVGGFLTDNGVARKTIANTFRSLKLRPPFFLRHADFLGALGSLHATLHRSA